jgi:hypothetical protein
LPLTALASSSVASQVEPGVLGFLIVAGIGIVLVFLLRSMNKQLRKVGADRKYFAQQPDLPARPGTEPAPTTQDRGGGDGQPS